MTAYILTPAQHSQLVDALEGTSSFVKLDEALEMLKAMEPSAPVGYTDDRGRFFYKEDPLVVDHEGMPAVYAMETKT